MSAPKVGLRAKTEIYAAPNLQVYGNVLKLTASGTGGVAEVNSESKIKQKP